MKFDEENCQVIHELGDIVDLSLDNTKEERLTAHMFESDYLFEYFKQLSRGQTGYGVSFIAWLELVKGWQHLGYKVFKKVEEIS
jgi:hypothetical protein